ncbi:hypothetical protein ACFVVM_16280 [Nocardia sp. NPDC058176]|uniref:hypothetical protein n=1 Tax=Nocardia sp. NPDC058176 TaxID=3346368 RepID=UPI0036DCDEED
MSQQRHGTPHPDRDYNHDERTIELLRTVGENLIQLAPPDWQRLDLEYRGTAAVSDYGFWCTLDSGKIFQIPEPLFAASRALDQLRDMMYEPGRGTWFLARYNLAENMEYRIVFDYDHDPLWFAPTDIGTWKTDLAIYPRDPQHMPKWLNQILSGEYKYLSEQGKQ